MQNLPVSEQALRSAAAAPSRDTATPIMPNETLWRSARAYSVTRNPLGGWVGGFIGVGWWVWVGMCLCACVRACMHACMRACVGAPHDNTIRQREREREEGEGRGEVRGKGGGGAEGERERAREHVIGSGVCHMTDRPTTQSGTAVMHACRQTSVLCNTTPTRHITVSSPQHEPYLFTSPQLCTPC